MAKDRKEELKAGLTELAAEQAPAPSVEDMQAAIEEIARLRALLEEKAAPGLTELPAADSPTPRRFRVKLPDCPFAHVLARDGHEAEQKYRRYCGILATQNAFEINELTEEIALADAEVIKTKGPHEKIHRIA